MTTFTDDEEARAMWRNEGVDPEHIQIMGMEDNFWTTGGPGPGGPCSEIYVDRGPEFGIEGGPIADENRYIEIWDLVFENYEVDKRQVQDRPAHRRRAGEQEHRHRRRPGTHGLPAAGQEQHL